MKTYRTLSTLSFVLALLLAVLLGGNATAADGGGNADVLARIAALEEELAALKEELACAPRCPDPCDEPEIETSLYGNIYLQWHNRQTELLPTGTDTFSDVDVYWGELGVDTSYEDWSGHFSVLLDDADNLVKFDEGWTRYQHADECGTDPAFFQIGRILVPFGNNTYYFPTYPAVNDLGYSTFKAVGGGFDSGESTFSAYLYNSPVELADAHDGLHDWTVAWDMTKQEAETCQNGWVCTVGYNSNLAAHDLNLAGLDELSDRVPGYNIFGRYDAHAGAGLLHMLADYTAAADHYDVADLDADGNNIGDEPSALNVEVVWEPETDTLWGVSYQLTDEMAGYANERWGLLYGVRLNKLAQLKLEYTHGSFDEFAPGFDTENTLVGEISLIF